MLSLRSIDLMGTAAIGNATLRNRFHQIAQ